VADADFLGAFGQLALNRIEPAHHYLSEDCHHLASPQRIVDAAAPADFLARTDVSIRPSRPPPDRCQILGGRWVKPGEAMPGG
jgi:hypothetical protein